MAEPTKQFRTRRLRRKADTGVADPARFAWTDGNSFDVTIGGIASDGDYVITITPTAPGVAAIPITVMRATTPATNTNIATAMVTAANVLLAAAPPPGPAALATYIESVSSSGAVVSFIVKRGAPSFTVATSETTATGTLTLAPNDTFPITMSTLAYIPPTGPRSHLALVLVPVNSSGTPLDPGTLAADLTVREYFDRGRRTNAGDIPETPVGVSSGTTATAWAAGAGYRIASGAGRFGVSLGAVSGSVGSGTLAALEVHVKEVLQ